MIKVVYLVVCSFLYIFSVGASTESLSPEELTRKYITLIGRSQDVSKIPKIETYAEGLRHIVQCMIDLTGLDHTHVMSGNPYGSSFVHKNEAPISYVKDLLTGNKKWTKDTILKTELHIADLGCGVGFCAAFFVFEVVSYYESQGGWKFKSPIQLDLYDVIPENYDVLQPLASLINGAFPQYFEVKTFRSDVADIPPVPKYQLIFAFNLLHYIPEARWPAVVGNIEEILSDNGILFATTDHYHVGVQTREEGECLKAAAQMRAEMGDSSSLVSHFIALVTPEWGQKYQTICPNFSFDSFLKKPEEYGPGDLKGIQDINEEALFSILQKSFSTVGRINLYDGKKLTPVSIKEVMDRFKKGQLTVGLPNYGFDENLLEKMIRNSSKGCLKPIKAKWPQDLLTNAYGYPSTVGITFLKTKVI